MASISSDFATAYTAATTSRTAGPSLADYDYNIRYRTVSVTVTSAFATAVSGGASDSATGATAYFELGPALFDGQVIPNESFISYDTGSTGTITAVTCMLQKYNSTDGLVALSGLATPSGAVADYFLDFSTPTTLPTVQKSDTLRVGIVAATTLTSGRTLRINVAYRPKHVS